jgi:hypothetical protein
LRGFLLLSRFTLRNSCLLALDIWLIVIANPVEDATGHGFNLFADIPQDGWPEME